MKTVGLLVVGAVALAAFVMVELRVAAPLIDVRLFRIRGVWTAHVVALIFGFAMYGTFVLVPTLLQLPTFTGYGFGKDASTAGLFLLPTVVMLIIVSTLTGILVRRFGPKPPLVLGGVFLTAAFVVPAISHAHAWQILLSGTLTGIGIGFGLAAASNAIIESVPAAQTGEAISANTVVRTIGSSVGTAVIAALISSQTKVFALPTGKLSLPADSAFEIGFWACAGVAALAIIGAVAAPGMRRRLLDARAAGVDDVDEVVG